MSTPSTRRSCLPQALGDALAAASDRDLAGRVGPALLTRLVAAGRWSLADALAEARRGGPEARWRTLAVLRPHCAQAHAEAVTAAGLVAAPAARAAALHGLGEHAAALRAIEDAPDDWYRVEALRALVPDLPAALLPEAARLAGAGSHPMWRAWALFGVAPRVPSVLLAALAAVSAEQHEQWRAYALGEFGALLTPELAGAALAIARGIEAPIHRAKALAAAVPLLPPAERPAAAAEALETATSIPDKAARAAALAALAPHLPTAQLLAAVGLPGRATSTWTRPEILLELAPHLPVDVLAAAMSASVRRGGSYLDSVALARLTPHLDGPQRQRALTAIRGDHYDAGRARGLAAFSAYAPAEARDGLLGEALDAVPEICEHFVQAAVIAELAPLLPSAQLPRAVDIARSLRYSHSREQALLGLAPYAPVGSLFTATDSLDTTAQRAALIEAIAPRLPDELLDRALAAARRSTDDGAFAAARVALLVHVPDGGPRVREALDATGATLAWAVPGLLEHLPNDFVAALAATARRLPERTARLDALAALLPRLAGEERRDAIAHVLAEARHTDDPKRHLVAVAPYLPSELVGEALDLGRFGDSIVGCLDDLAPHLPADRLAEVLAEVAAHDPYSRVWGLTALAPHLPDVLLPDALTLARDIDDLPPGRADAVGALLVRLPAVDAAREWRVEWAAALTARGPYDRAAALVSLAWQSPADERAGAVAAATAAALDTGMGTMASHLLLSVARALSEPDAVVADLLLRAHAERRPRDVADALTRVLSVAPGPELAAEALAAARAIPDDDQRLIACVALAPYLDAESLAQVVAAVAASTEPYARERHVAALAPHLSAELLEPLLAVAEEPAPLVRRAREVLADGALAAFAVRALDGRSRAACLAVIAELGRPELLSVLDTEQQERP